MRSKQEKNAKKPRAKKQKLDFVQDYLGIRDLRNGILEMSDGRYIKILEIEPINFTLRSDEEQYNIISSFASWLKISPMRLQFKSITRKADSDKHIAMVQAELAQEDNAQCRALGEEYIKLIRDVGSREALTRRFFLVFEYEAVGRHESNDYAKIYAALQTVEHNARAYFLQCGNSIVQPKDPDEATAEILYMFYNRHSCVNEPFSSRVNRVVVDTMAAENKVIGIDPIPSIPIAHFLAPRGIDLTHHNYIIMDGRYYTILYIRGNGYGYTGTAQSYDVVFTWDNQTNSVVMAQSITSTDENGNTTTTEYEVINAEDATAEFTEQQTLKFHNDRVKPEIDIYKKDIKTGELVAGAVYNLITTDNIYNADGKLLFHAGDLIATSAPTDENGHTTFICDLPMRGQYYGVDGVYIPENIYGTDADHTKNSGNYIIREIKAPDGYYLDAPDAEISDDNVLVYERQFYDDVVLVAVNRQPDQSYTIGPVETNLPAGNYNDYLGGLLYGFNTVVTAGEGINHTSSFTLPGGAVCVWQYKGPASSTPQIGDVMSTMGRVGNQVYIYGDGLNGDVSVKFGDVEAVVESNSANQIVTKVPTGAVPGDNNITVTKGSSVSNAFVYNVLSGDQNQIIFHVQANTAMGENIYIVGNIPELGSWDPDNCTEAMLNPNYPEWFLPVSVPAGTQIEFKFIKKDANGTVTWESGENRVITSSSSSAGSIDTEVYTWRS